MLAIWFSNYTRSPHRNRTSDPAVLEAAPAFESSFWRLWGDGQAELAGYDLTYPRYGAARRGVAVSIFVTESFSSRLRVKAEPGKHPASDQFPVMKLNLVKDYQTGIYDYNEMTSAFVALAPANGHPAGSAAKVSFSSQEWCGHVYLQALFDPRTVRTTSHSYFDGEADSQIELDYPPGGISEDVLMPWARGMARPVLEPGQSRDLPVLLSLETRRHAHVAAAWKKARLERSAATRQITVPAGSFDVEVWSAELEGGLRKTFFVESGGARRVVQWETSAGERAVLLGSDRMKYWEGNAPGGEEALKKLGLAPRPPRTS